MKPDIQDLTGAEQTKRPIEIVGVLQDFYYPQGDFRFESTEGLKAYNYKSIKRLHVLKGHTSLDGLSLVEIDGMIALARWNDGVA